MINYMGAIQCISIIIIIKSQLIINIFRINSYYHSILQDSGIY